MQTDPFKNYARSLESPGTRHFTVTPADGIDTPIRPRALYVNTDGTLALRDSHGEVVHYNVEAGQILPFSAVGVESTGTTAVVIGWY